jgi:hypothetical protein
MTALTNALRAPVDGSTTFGFALRVATVMGLLTMLGAVGAEASSIDCGLGANSSITSGIASAYDRGQTQTPSAAFTQCLEFTPSVRTETFFDFLSTSYEISFHFDLVLVDSFFMTVSAYEFGPTHLGVTNRFGSGDCVEVVNRPATQPDCVVFRVESPDPRLGTEFSGKIGVAIQWLKDTNTGVNPKLFQARGQSVGFGSNITTLYCPNGFTPQCLPPFDPCAFISCEGVASADPGIDGETDNFSDFTVAAGNATTLTTVPEPATWTLLGSGLLLAAVGRRQSRK